MINEPPSCRPSDSSLPFQWNLYGILGGTIGPILFLLFGAFRLPDHPGYGVTLLTLFLLPLAVARFLWQRRHSLPAYTGVQILLSFVIFSVFVGAFIFYRFGITVPLLVERPVTLPILISIPISYIVLALLFCILQRRQIA